MLSDDELDRLDKLLLSIPMDTDGMLLSEFDGFCAGLVVSPEMIRPGEWLPCVWGSSMEQMESLDDIQGITDLATVFLSLPKRPISGAICTARARWLTVRPSGNGRSGVPHAASLSACQT